MKRQRCRIGRSSFKRFSLCILTSILMSYIKQVNLHRGNQIRLNFLDFLIDVWKNRCQSFVGRINHLMEELLKHETFVYFEWWIFFSCLFQVAWLIDSMLLYLFFDSLKYRNVDCKSFAPSVWRQFPHNTIQINSYKSTNYKYILNQRWIKL